MQKYLINDYCNRYTHYFLPISARNAIFVHQIIQYFADSIWNTFQSQSSQPSSTCPKELYATGAQPGAFPVRILVRPARTYSNGRKSPNRPDSGKVTAKGKGVHREVESEGSRRQTVGPMNKNLVEGWKAGVMLLEKQKPDNYPNCRQ